MPTNPVKIKGPELQYARQLRKIARHIGDVINAFTPGDPHAAKTIHDILTSYAQTLTPWAKVTAERMLKDIAKRDRKAWEIIVAKMSRAMRNEIDNAPTGEVMRRLLDEQIHLIRSLPIEAAQRVHKLTQEALINGDRAGEIIKAIEQSGSVCHSRATLIARTECSRAASLLTQARAQRVGATHYVWETSRDEATRNSHRALQGKVIAFSDPPTTDGLTYHAGQGPNCRCWMRVIVDLIG